MAFFQDYPKTLVHKKKKKKKYKKKLKDWFKLPYIFWLKLLSCVHLRIFCVARDTNMIRQAISKHITFHQTMNQEYN